MFEQVAQILHKNRNISLDNIKESSTFADLGLDSLDVVDLVMEFESHFGVEIEVNDKIKTVGDVSNLIASLKK